MLSPDPTALLAEYRALAMELLRRDGLRLLIHDDLARFTSLLETAPNNAGINPAFDPRRVEIGAAFWLHVKSGDGRSVAVMAAKLLTTDAYYADVAAGRIWGCDPLTLAITGPDIGGRLAHTGGLWVAPDWRGIGLSWLIPRLIRAIALQLWNVDHSTGLAFASLHHAGIAKKNYGAQKIRLLVDGWFPPTGQTERIYATEYDRAYLLQSVREDARVIADHRNHQMRDLAPIASKRQNQAPIDADSIAR
ncbi:MAG: hypothetical protein NXI18_18580 [Alphaproteobacteria bacterium]|nr:hypothetical protein [Alphaproteobacteria bacterium]